MLKKYIETKKIKTVATLSTITACATLFSFLPLTSAHADSVHLKNADRISGQIVEMFDEHRLHFKTSFGQTIFIPWENVDGLYDAKDEPMNSPYIGKAAPATDMVLTPAAPAMAEKTAPESAKVAEVATAESEEDKFLGADWKGRINLGASLEEGNSETENFNLDGHLEADWYDIHRVKLDAELNKEKENDTDTEDNFSIDGVYDYFFHPKWFINTNAGYEEDDMAELDARYDIGAGLGYQPFKSKPLNLSMTLGMDYLRDEFSTGEEEDTAAYRWTLDYDQKVWKDMFTLFHTHEILVPSDEESAYLLESETGIRMPIRAGIVGTFQVDFDRDNAPEPGVEKDDTKYGLKLGYEW